MSLAARGWQRFAAEPATTAWVDATWPRARALLERAPRRHGGTWTPGVDLLDNDGKGRVHGGIALGGAALAAAQALYGPLKLHRAQLSVAHPGYPGRDADETDAAHRFRARRDAAHLDGLLPEGPRRRRFLREPHAWILGLALTRADPGAAPFTLYEGSHRLIAGAFSTADSDTDLTETYAATRAAAFQTCPRIEVPLAPGEAILVHRMVLHGTAPWRPQATAAPEGRVLAFFRPCLDNMESWLAAP